MGSERSHTEALFLVKSNFGTTWRYRIVSVEKGAQLLLKKENPSARMRRYDDKAG
jgi:hypothetical protein